MKKDNVKDNTVTNSKKKNIIKQEAAEKTIRKKRFIKKIIVDIILLILLVISGYYTFKGSVFFNKEKKVKYNEKSNVNYKVYLNKNDFYEKEYLDKDMLYVASLIDNIVIDFDYNFESELKESIDFTYNITAKLMINNQAGNKNYYEKSYILLSNKNLKMTNEKNKNIHEQIKIDYSYYNVLASEFKTRYGIDAESKLIVYMTVNKKNTKDSNFVLDNSSTMNVEIPLSQRAIEIKLDYKEINETNSIIEKKSFNITNIYYFSIVGAISVVSAVIILLLVINTFRLFKKRKNEYEKYVSKILKGYDRLIAETSTLISFKNKEIVNISKFTELLDIHDNLQLPIMYYEKSKGQSGYFYICHDKMIYLFEISIESLIKEHK